MKALAGRGGGFFMGGKRMRGFGLGPPGMDDGRFGFYDGMGGPEFGYPGGPGGRFGGGEFYPGPGGGPPPNMSFNPAGETEGEGSEIFELSIQTREEVSDCGQSIRHPGGFQINCRSLASFSLQFC